jgi:hypothetical protein
VQTKSNHFGPVLVLFFLAPALGELLSGSSPPVEFFHPFGLLVMGVLYGGGAILIRELRVRWNKGWPTLFVGICWAPLLAGIVRWMSCNGAWNALHQLALAGGAMGFFILFAPLQELDSARTDNTMGMSLVALATLVFLIWLWWRTKKTERRRDTSSGTAHSAPAG